MIRSGFGTHWAGTGMAEDDYDDRCKDYYRHRRRAFLVSVPSDFLSDKEVAALSGPCKIIVQATPNLKIKGDMSNGNH